MKIVVTYDLYDSVYRAYEIESFDGSMMRKQLASHEDFKELMRTISYYGTGGREVVVATLGIL